MMLKNMLPVLDIFAGPGGLGEGFSQMNADVRLSVEMNSTACQTLRIRKFFNSFGDGEAPCEYYQFIRGEISLDELKHKFSTQWSEANLSVLKHELGTDNAENLYIEIEKKFKIGENFVLIGGPPCQAYSLAGRSRKLGIGAEREQTSQAQEKLKSKLSSEFYSDKRHTLYLEYVKILAKYQPALFVMENVKGLVSAKSGADEYAGSVFENLSEGLRAPEKHTGLKPVSGKKSLGYKLYSLGADTAIEANEEEVKNARNCIIKAEDYGVPQSRHRVIIIGVREDITGKPEKLKKSSRAYTVRDAISDLPKLRSGLSKEIDNDSSWREAIVEQVNKVLVGKTDLEEEIAAVIGFLKGANAPLDRGSKFIKENLELKSSSELSNLLIDRKIGGYLQHETRSHIRSDLLRYLFCSAYAQRYSVSPKFSDWQGDLKQLKPSHQNIHFEENRLTSKSHIDRFKVQTWDKPSSTIVSHISKDGHYFIHPDPLQCRSLTVREAARLQTFPDNYFFAGPKTEQYHQVGNAVPVILAKNIARSCINFLNEVL